MYFKILVSLILAFLTISSHVNAESVGISVSQTNGQGTKSSSRKKSTSNSKKQTVSAGKSSKSDKGTNSQKRNSQASGKQAVSSKKGKTSSTNNKNKGKKSATSGKVGKNNPKSESSADVRRQQEATQREISDTKKQIQLNDASIKKGVDELGRLQGDIGESKEKVKVAATEVNALAGKIAGLERQVSEEEAQLVKLRSEYLKAIKKMRASGKSNSTLAFVFSSGSFNQALRRMRYLKQFSEWKDRQSSMIVEKVDRLKEERKELSRALSAKDAALRQHQAAQSELEKQYARQDAIVVELRANGDALNAHLAKKQAEANTLRNRISALIAAEEQQRRAREEEQRQAREAEEKRAREAEERRAREEAEKKEDRSPAVADVKYAEPKRVEAESQEKSKSNKTEAAAEKKEKGASRRQTQKNTTAKKDDSGKSSSEYANARKRRPRSETKNTSKAPAKSSSSSKGTTSSSDAGSFEKMRGSLPHPVSGSFRIISPFGRHSLPELPDVVYDNPGIDAQTSAGASALAVYQGKVSGVYMIPGFSTVVIVNHGNYYTVYGNIASPAVKVGDSVRQGQNLGKLAVDEDDSSHSAIHFEVWRNREKLNPAEWIR